ncbi:MAG TPA: hypothetical protein VK589_06070 [Chryseolinea sp.]|nr:hypothetical protein [Chryseolinea sp.]
MKTPIAILFTVAFSITGFIIGRLSYCSYVSITTSEEEEKFIQISPQAGGITCMTESGTFGSMETTETYFINFIAEDYIKLKHGFLILKLKRTHKEEGQAYKIIDDYNNLRRAEHLSGNGLSEEKEFLETIAKAREINGAVNDHLKIQIEREAIETGISENGVLVFKP